MPELAPHARAATLFHPERAEPDHRSSSIGGPLLWPADEPWPTCSLPDENSADGTPANAMVPVVQIFRRDAPGAWWPADADLLQILWCPNEHWDPPLQQADISPVVEFRWRRAAEVTGQLLNPPAPSRYDEDSYLPRACTVTAEQVTDFPFRDELPAELHPRLEKLVHETGGDGHDVITRLAGWKLGGWPTWHLTQPTEIPCEDCGTAMTLLFTVASDNVTGVVVGRWGDLRIFTCPTDHRHAFQVDLH
ncbi:hypothetical protein GCM10010329_30840 [Streptomyces spiroverticillatus]|uniref:DUF1963 domain-containing protein n=1 Tax=Streptomyces finlayi TaxID=67296 RepID=A0A918WW96_9ACTN|nr:hypothetical protein [Streptomyces finlayi]GHA06149.1 hypothetical protein GCM10010329_30840 [Streptomyces spiroverticillatus]GHC89790.1 hypothetical protein GCM10010334_23250 [Streptomyces finlayi]